VLKIVKRKRQAKKKVVRRTNVERSATTRGKLLDAAIGILASEGYAATTTTHVSRKANVSRGAMLHQFPTRVDLLIAVAEHVLNNQERARLERLEGLAPRERFFATAEVAWEVQNTPDSRALMEITMATLGDRELRARSDTFMKHVEELQLDAANRLAVELGVNNPGAMQDLVYLHVAAMYGLSFQLILGQESGRVERARLLLERMEKHFADHLIKAAGVEAASAE
jgi:AcrR family transcriptional regulator